MDITRLSGIAIAIALIYACAGRAAPGSGEDASSAESADSRSTATACVAATGPADA